MFQIGNERVALVTDTSCDLSDEQLREWNAIYASYRSESLLTARVAGMDQSVVTVRNKKPAEGSRGASPVWW